jgi:hypothetical protein
MKLHRLRQTAFWGDYGTTLARGLHAKRDQQSGLLQMERVGPFAPPMIFSIEAMVGFVVLVTQSFREKLEAANFGELTFRPTIKKHIVRVPWETWDRQTRLPPVLPDSGEPEEYVLGQRHSEQTAAEMEEIWEFVAPDVPFEIEKSERVRAFHKRWYVTAPKGEHGGLFRPPGDGHVLFVDEAGRRWFEREGQGWVDFDEVVVV